VSFAWTQSANLDYNFKLERRVGQLNFYDFLASVNVTNDQQNAGNPDLVPPQTWELSAEINRKLGAWGNTTLRLYGQRIDDIVDTIPHRRRRRKPGQHRNRDDLRLRMEGHAQPRPDRLARREDRRVWQMEHSNVEDPLTFEDRPISNNLQSLATLGLRHDIPKTDWAWGGDLEYQYYEQDYRLTEVGRQWEGPLWASLFVENKNVAGMTVAWARATSPTRCRCGTAPCTSTGARGRSTSTRCATAPSARSIR
jgi:hypothetical protein